MTVENPYHEVTATVPRAHGTKIPSHALQGTEARLERITQGLAKVIGPDLIRASLEHGRTPKIIWGKCDCVRQVRCT